MLGCGDGKPCKGRVAPREGARAGLGGRLTTGPLGRRASSPPSPSAGSGCTSFLPDLPFFPLNCRGEARADVSPPPPSSRGTVGRCVSAGSRCGDAFARTGGGRCRGRAGLRSGAPSEPAAPPVVPRAPYPKLSPGEARGGGGGGGGGEREPGPNAPRFRTRPALSWAGPDSVPVRGDGVPSTRQAWGAAPRDLWTHCRRYRSGPE